MALPSPDAFGEDAGEEDEEEKQKEKERIQEEMERMEEAQQEAEENRKFEFFREPAPKSWFPWGSAHPAVDRGPINAPVAPLGSSSLMAAGGGNAAAAAATARSNEAVGANSGGSGSSGAFGRMFSWLPWSGTTAAAPSPGTLAVPDDEAIANAGADERRRQGLETDGQQQTRGSDRRETGAVAAWEEPEAVVDGVAGEKKKKKRKTPRMLGEKGERVGRGEDGGPRDIEREGLSPRLRGSPGEGKEAEEKGDQNTLGAYLMAPLSLMPWSNSITGGGALDEGKGEGVDYKGMDEGEGLVEEKKKKPRASKGRKKDAKNADEEEGDEEKGSKGVQNDGAMRDEEEEDKEEAKNRAAAVPVKGTIASRAARMMSMFSLRRSTPDTAAKIGLDNKEGEREEGEEEEEEIDNVERESRVARLMSIFSLRRGTSENREGEGEEKEQDNVGRREGKEQLEKEGGEAEKGEGEGEGNEGGEGEEDVKEKPLSLLQKLKKRLQTEDGEPEDLEVLADRLVGALSNGEINLATYRMAKRYAKGKLLKKLVEKERERAYKIMKRKERREAEKNMTWGEYFKSKVNLKDLMPKIKILTTVFQIVGGLPATLGISFGGGAGSIFSIFGVVNFGGVSFGSPQCYAAYDYVDRFATTLLYPTLSYLTLKSLTNQFYQPYNCCVH